MGHAHAVTTSPVLRASPAEQLLRLRGAGPLPDELLDVVVERLEVGEDLLTLVHPTDWPRLREVEHDAGRAVPYWAIAWPSGVALARVLRTRDLHGARVLELGCGLAVASVMAASRGGEVTATDASPDAVVFAAHNLVLNGLAGGTGQADWREPGLLVAGGPWVPRRRRRRPPYPGKRRDAARPPAPSGHPRRRGPAHGPRPLRGGEFLPVARRHWRLESRPDAERAEVRLHRLRRR